MAKELTPAEDVFPAESLKTSTVGKEVNSHSEPKGKGLRGSIDENESSDMDVLSDERRNIKLDYKYIPEADELPYHDKVSTGYPEEPETKGDINTFAEDLTPYSVEKVGGDINTFAEDLTPYSVEEVGGVLVEEVHAVFSEEADGNNFQLMQVSSEMQRMLNLVNSERRSRGRSQLCFNSKLNAAAQAHNNDMASNNYFSHTSRDGTRASTRISRKGYSWRAYGENIAINSSIDSAHRSLMNSQGHRDNILKSSFKHMGIGVSRYTSGRWNGQLVVTQVFGNSNSESCSGGSGGSGGCADSPRGWFDSDGSDFHCGWYARGDNCQRYGSGFRNFGKTAKEACCACGGGSD